MKVLGSLMLVFFITRAATDETLVIPKGQDPLVHYQCSGNTSSYNITIHIMNNITFNSYAIKHDAGNYNLNNATDSCERKFTDISANVTETLTNCKQETFYLYIMAKPAFVTSKTTPAYGKKIPVIAGGKSFHEYEINCKVQARGSLYNLAHSFNDSKTNDSRKTKENPDLKLALSIEGSSPIYIGDQVKLTVKDTTDVPNYLNFIECIATVPDNTDISSISLITNGSAIEKDIIPAVNKPSIRGTNSVDLYAFRFATSSQVKISCTIKACPEKDCTTPTRRRRSVNNELSSDSKTVSVTFEVHDKKESSGGIKVGYVSSLLLTAIVFGWMKLL